MVAPLMQQGGGVPLATWLLVLIAMVTLLLTFDMDRQAHEQPTPQRVEQVFNQTIIQQVRMQRGEPAPEPPPHAP